MSDAAPNPGYVRTFNRFELKFLIHHRQARELLRLLDPHVRFDAHRGHDGFYKVVSLYYDSEDLRCYWEKIDGEKYRRKVRVRTYGHDPEEAFLEIKQRYNISVQKRRCKAPFGEIEQRMAGICAGHLEPGLDPVFDEAYVLAQRYRLRPTVIISYQRAAFFDLYKRDLRITLDRNIKARHLSLDLKANRMGGIYAVPPTMMLLEVKFNEAIPRWLCTFLNRFDLKLQRISKFCAGVERCGLHERTLVNR